MKKNIIKILLLLSVTLFFTACGSNTKEGPVNPGTPGGGTPPTSAYTLANVTTPIIVNESDAVHVISVDVIDANGVGVSDKNVSISAVQGAYYGAIISASITQTDQSGHALFSYKAPSDITAVDKEETIVTVRFLEDGKTVMSEDVTISFDETSSVVPGETLPIVVAPTDTYTIKENSKSLQMEIRVFEEDTSTPFTTGQVKVILPRKVIDGVDVGSFTEYNVSVDSSGKAVFNYTGPQNLEALIDSGDTGAEFEFYHIDNPSNKTKVTTTYDISGGGYIPAQYFLTAVSGDGNYAIGLNKQKTFTIYLKDDRDNDIPNDDIKNISITTQNAVVGKLDNSGTSVENLTFIDANAVNAKSFDIVTETTSGLVPVEIVVDFIDANGAKKKITMLMNAVVLSGPPTAMSISYAGVEQNTTTAKYIEKLAVTVTDAYNNPVNTNPFISAGTMVEYAVDGSGSGTRTTSSPRLWHGKNDTHGTIADPDGSNKTTFDATSDSFKYVDFANDKLVVFGAGFVYEALGKWDIDALNSSDSLLALKDDYFGISRAGLYYAVGHNNRQDLCRPDGTEYVGNMTSSQYQIDSSGHALIEFSYDYHLTGKDTMVWVNLTGYQADTQTTIRIGESKKHTLRGAGLVTRDAYTLKPGDSDTLRFYIHHENAPEWLKNAHVGYSVVGACTATKAVAVADESCNDWDARDCRCDEVFVTLDVVNNTTEDCTITLGNIAVANEFNRVTYP